MELLIFSLKKDKSNLVIIFGNHLFEERAKHNCRYNGTDGSIQKVSLIFPSTATRKKKNNPARSNRALNDNRCRNLPADLPQFPKVEFLVNPSALPVMFGCLSLIFAKRGYLLFGSSIQKSKKLSKYSTFLIPYQVP